MPKKVAALPDNPRKDINGNEIRTRRPRNNLDPKKLHTQAMTVLARDIEKLMDKSYRSKLSRDEATALIAYLKLLNEIKALKELEEIEKKNVE